MASKTIVLFGAGATKACGGPLTNEILPQAFEPMVRSEIEREYYIDLLEKFLIENFHLPQRQADRAEADYPALPLLLSLVDTAIDRSQPMGSNWTLDLMRQVRRALQYMVFAFLEYKLRRISHNYYADLLRILDPTRSESLTIISLNYDIIVDNAMVKHSDYLPDYGCDITTDRYKALPHKGSLLKIHGSLNWSYCPSCNRLDLGVSESGKTYKMLNELYQVNPLEARYSCHGFPCPQCSTFVEPVLITPTQLKDYRNPHVQRVWTLAEQELRSAERVIIVGYSLPDDDLDVIYLLKRGLSELAKRAPKNITVVEYTSDDTMRVIDMHPVGRRYRTIFGPAIDWRTDGFEGLIAEFRGSESML
ncbi:MAG: SIR2 family protein [Methylomicrobium sp.]